MQVKGIDLGFCIVASVFIRLSKKVILLILSGFEWIFEMVYFTFLNIQNCDID